MINPDDLSPNGWQDKHGWPAAVPAGDLQATLGGDRATAVTHHLKALTLAQGLADVDMANIGPLLPVNYADAIGMLVAQTTNLLSAIQHAGGDVNAILGEVWQEVLHQHGRLVTQVVAPDHCSRSQALRSLRSDAAMLAAKRDLRLPHQPAEVTSAAADRPGFTTWTATWDAEPIDGPTPAA